MVSKDLLSAGGAMWSSESTIIAQGEEVPVFVSLRVFIVIMVFIWFRKVENEIKDCESAKVVFMSNLSRRLYWYSDEHVYGIERGWNGMDMIGLLQYLSSKCEWKKGRSHQCHHGPHKLIQVGQKQDMMGYQMMVWHPLIVLLLVRCYSCVRYGRDGKASPRLTSVEILGASGFLPPVSRANTFTYNQLAGREMGGHLISFGSLFIWLNPS